jgi:hypothetical protein
MNKHLLKKSDYENYLNLNVQGSYEDYVYMTVKTRNGGYISSMKLRIMLDSNKLGTLLRKLDSIAFNVGFNDWKREKQGHL